MNSIITGISYHLNLHFKTIATVVKHAKPFPDCLNQFIYDTKTYVRVPLMAILSNIILAFFWFSFRRTLNKYLFSPFNNILKVKSDDKHKFDESAWKVIFYLITASLSYYCIKDCNMFDKDLLTYGMELVPSIPWNISLLYLIECSFYIYSIYASVFIDTHRSDTNILIFHHFQSIALILLSYCFKYVYFGIFVIFLQDTNDILLEISKCCRYASRAPTNLAKFWDNLSTICFITFSTCWFLMRVYSFYFHIFVPMLLKVGITIPPTRPYLIIFYVLLMVIYFLNIFWTILILKIIIRTLFFGMTINDVREKND